MTQTAADHSTIWTPLDHSKRQIRLAHLAPSKDLDERPSCSLEIVSLDDEPEYEALSYAWGNPDVTDIIRLGSTTWPVTTNLKAGLRYLRHETEHRVLWIDAICIDQTNNQEKNHQVRLMKSIFGKAEAVRVWLGEATPGSDTALAILEQLGERIQLCDVRIQGEPLNDRHLELVIQLLKRQWWSRVWVHQELILARTATFHCGSRSLDRGSIFHVGKFLNLDQLGEFSEASYRQFNNNGQKEFGIALISIQSLEILRILHDPIGTTTYSPSEKFARILNMGGFLNASNPRDSIYGFLGLADESIASNIEPNYNAPPEEVYRDTAIKLMNGSDSLTLFFFAQYTMKPHYAKPSWAPSWSNGGVPGSVEYLAWLQRGARVSGQGFLVCGKHKIQFEIIGKDTLKLFGTCFDFVSKMTEVNKNSRWSEQESHWREVCGLVTTGSCRSRYIAGGKAEDAYWRTLVNDFSMTAEGQRRSNAADRQGYSGWLDELKMPAETYWRHEQSQFFGMSVYRAGVGRRIFVTNRGYFGVGPAELEQGDAIYILAGGTHCYALRPCTAASRLNTFELIGDCYVHGIMDGEAVADHASGYQSHGDRLRKLIHGGYSPDPELPKRDFHDVYIV